MITFSCECGKRYQVKDELSGRRAKCACGKTNVIPQPAQVASSASTIPSAVVAQPTNKPTPTLDVAEAYAAILVGTSQGDEYPTGAGAQAKAISPPTTPTGTIVPSSADFVYAIDGSGLSREWFTVDFLERR